MWLKQCKKNIQLKLRLKGKRKLDKNRELKQCKRLKELSIMQLKPINIKINKMQRNNKNQNKK